MSDWTCRCSAKNAERDRYCEGCGGENPKAPRPQANVAKPTETHAPAKLPAYPAAAPGDDALIRAEIAKVNALLGITGAPPPTSRLPPVDPAIRAQVERRAGPEPIAATMPAALERLRRVR